MGRRTNAAGVAAVIVAASTAWVLSSGGEPPEQGAALPATLFQPGASVGADSAPTQPRAEPASTPIDPGPAQAVAARPAAPAVVPTIDWARYPGTLHTQVQQALQGRDGVMAADLARKLRECEAIAGQLQPKMIQRYAMTGGEAAVQAIRHERLQEYQRILANCQTVLDSRSAQLALLDRAVEQRVIGAAVQSLHLFQRRPEVLQGVVRDAIAGDVSSLVVAASHLPSTLGMSKELQRSLRYAFELAAGDPDVGALVRRYVSIAESVAPLLRSETEPRFNHDGLTDAQRAQARDTAGQLVRRVKEPRDDVVKVG